MKHKVSKFIFLTIFLCFVFSLNSKAVTYTWTGATSTAWNVSTNWSPSGYPSAIGDSAVIGPASNNPIITTLNISIGAINILSNGSLTLGTNGNLSLSSTLTIHSAGTFDMSATTTGLTIGGSCTIDGTFKFPTASAASVTISGNLSGASSGSINMSIAPTAVLNLKGLLNDGYLGGLVTTTTGTVVYNGIGTQTIFPATYRNLTIGSGTATGTKVLVGTTACSVLGTLTIASTSGGAVTFNLGTYSLPFNVTGPATFTPISTNAATLDFGGSPAKTVTIGGNLSGASAGSTIVMGGAPHTLVLNGTVLNSLNTLTTTGNGSTVTYGANAAQPVFASNNYENITFAGTGTKTLAGSGSTATNVTIGSGTGFTISSTSTLNVKGDWTNNGSFSAGTSTITFSGAGPQNIAGASATSFSSLIDANTIAVVTCMRNFTATSTTLFPNTKLDLGALTGYSLGTTSGSGTLLISAANSGTTTFPTSTSGPFFGSGGGTVEYNTNNSYTIGTNPVGYNNVVISSLGGKIINTPETMFGNLTVTSGTGLQINNTTGIVTVNSMTINGVLTSASGTGSTTITGGDVTVGPGGSIGSFPGASGLLKILSGNIVNNGSFTGQVVEFSNTSAMQAILGNACLFSTLQLNNSGQKLDLQNAGVTVLNSINYLTAGTINLNNADLTLLGSCNISGGGASSTIDVGGGTGKIIQQGSVAGNFTKTYPLSIGGVYSSFAINTLVATIGGSSQITIKAAIDASCTNCIRRYLSLTSSGITPVSDFRFDFDYTPGDVNGIPGTLRRYVATTPNAVTGKYVTTAPYKFGVNATGNTFIDGDWKTAGLAPTITGFSPSIVCAGDVVTVNGSDFTGTTGVTINGVAASSIVVVNDNTMNITVSPTAATGTGTIIVTSPLGSGTSPSNITVQAKPIVSAGLDKTVCHNNPTTTLSGSFSGGATGITWNNGGGIYSPNNANPTATYTLSPTELTAGLAELIIISSGSGACASATDTVFINVTPAPTSNAGSPQSICENATATLNGSVSVGSNPTWSGGSGGTFSNPNIQTPTYTPGSGDISAGSVTLTLTATQSGCLPVSSTVTISINPLPLFTLSKTDACTPSNNGTISFSTSVTTFTYNYVPGSTYTGGTPTTATINGVNTIPSLAAGMYTVRLYNPSTTCFSDRTITIGSNTPPSLTLTSTDVCGGSANGTISFPTSVTNLTYAITSGSTYTGTVPTSPTVNGTNTFSSLGAGIYTIRLYDPSTTCFTDQSTTINSLVPPTATISSSATNACNGSSINLDINFTGTAPWNFTYSDGTTSTHVNSIAASPYSFSVTPPLGNTTYTLTGVDDGTCIGATSGSATITVSAAPTATINTSSPPICGTGSATLNVNFTGLGPWDFSYSDGSSIYSVTGISINPYSFSVSPTGTTTYTLSSVADGSGCTGTTSGTATVTVQTGVSIPDVNFANWLTSNYPSCMCSNILITGCSALSSATSIDVSNLGITNLTGIQYFPNLITLDASGNSLSNLPTLPSSLLTLNVANNTITTFPALPTGLTNLNFSGNGYSGTIPSLPSGITTLDLSNNSITSLPSLPSSIQTLDCSHNQLATLPSLPNSLCSLIANTNLSLCYTNAPSCPGFTADIPSCNTTIGSFTPSSGCVGDSISISGGGFIGTSSVVFNGTAAGFVVKNDNLIVAAVPAGVSSGTISVTSGSSAVSSASFTVNASPVITLDPVDASVCAGIPVSFNVTATGAGLTYQWRFNGTNIPGTAAQLATYTISSPSSTDAGNYDVVVSGMCNPFATSNQAGLTVTPAPDPSLAVNTLVTTSCNSGTPSAIQIPASESGVNYQPFYNTTALSSTVAGTSSSITLSVDASLLPVGNDVITIQATKTGCNPVTLTNTASMTISASPNTSLSVTSVSPICSGSNGTVTIASSENGVSYQANTGGSAVGTAVVGNGSSITLTIPTPANGNNTISVDATASGCATVTMTTTPSIQVNSTPLSSISVSPAKDTLCQGDNASITIQSSENGVTYTAYDHISLQVGAPVTGDGTDKNITVTFAQLDMPANGISVQAVVGGCPAVTLTAVDTIYKSSIAAPSIIPSSSTLCSTNPVLFTVSPSFSQYHWYYGSTAAFTAASQLINGGTNSEVVYQPGYYFIELFDIYGCSTVTAGQYIDYGSALPSIAQAGNTGSQVDLSCANTASYYQWYVENASGVLKYIEGANAANFRAYFDGTYYVAIKVNSCYLYSAVSTVSGMAGGNVLRQGFAENDSSIVIPTITSGEILEIYPNPSAGAFELQYLSTSNEPIKVTLYNSTGKPMVTKEISQRGFITIPFDAAELTAGVYMIETVQQETVMKKRVMIVK
ncbi:MAG TPA: T9SS type A sorting domain-containing protein [Cytophagaceae bacterium]|nr:T9SS type A sorting domain-containing protein [Cytophagaceae bacterium]